MPSEFIYRRRVEFCETDLAGIVHFANFYRYMEQAEHAFLHSLGLSIIDHMPDGSTIGWPRVSAKCRFEAPAHYYDELEVRLRVARKGVKSLTYEVEIHRGKTRLATGEMKTVCCTVRPGKPLQSIELPAKYAELIEEYVPVQSSKDSRT